MMTWLGKAIARKAASPFGSAGPARRPALGVTRLEEREVPAGVLDPTFGTGGKTTTAFDIETGGGDIPAGVAVDAAGRTVVAGTVDIGEDVFGNIHIDFAV